MAITPDTKNWTWILERACPECGFDSAATRYEDIPALARANAEAWSTVLTRPNITVRPDEQTWSALEYAAHVRDVFRIFAVRLRLMLDESDPEFPNWDQDETAVTERYSEQDPRAVGAGLLVAAGAVADAFEAVPPDMRDRTGRRSDGASFTVESLAKYFIHDPIHHLADVSR
ncbi:methyltransferase type 12 [Rhodococcus sp. WMMA185]|uniref:DinB family protein n=1 Tax=Rhodococcus sp. WMMA185 TaxID=679318 RepID=UPI0008782D7A|nr:DinB family protein [Rhodococcus sp. WMMA185]AOW94759.1 methyltransferase type 12 [Rhodococcus sp. WMMA185]